MSLSLVQWLLSEVGFAPSAASVEHVDGPTLPVISRSYVDTEFHGSLNSPVVNFADSNESLLKFSLLIFDKFYLLFAGFESFSVRFYVQSI